MTKMMLVIYYIIVFVLAVYLHNLIGSGQTLWGSVFVGTIISVGPGTAMLLWFRKSKKA